MPLSSYSLDKFVAPKLSLLTECGAPELATEANWLNPFILNSVLGRGRSEKGAAYVMTFLRRAEGAFASYRAGRAELLQYLANRTNNVISPYFRALLNFETCLAQWCEGANVLKAAFNNKKYYDKGDQSKEERISCLYNDSKHADERIAHGQIPAEVMSPIWITNQGLESSKAALSFDELRQLLLEMGDLAKKVSEL
jgi:hypothetical protein